MTDPRLVVGALIVDSVFRPTRVLAARRTGPAALVGRWEFPGGKVDAGETPEEALRRELFEELGLSVEVGDELGSGWPISNEYVLRLFYCTTHDESVIFDGSHDKIRWVKPADIASLDWLDSDRQALPFVFVQDWAETEAVSPEEIARRSGEAMWASDRASRWLGMELVDVGPGTSTLQLELTDEMVNGHDIGHGGITFMLADSAFAFACNSYNRVTVAASAEIRFRRPTRLGDVLVATATERSREGRDGVYDVTVTVGEDVVAEFVGRSKEIGGVLYEEESA
ncbi:MAG: hydroxyphenylacetyl-CoA thioesterase PaaI [Aeromicrobium sp.]